MSDMQWQPIKTAPLGEKIMITHWDDTRWVGTGIRWRYEDVDGEFESYCSVLHYNDTVLVSRFYATHWMPLPDPPPIGLTAAPEGSRAYLATTETPQILYDVESKDVELIRPFWEATSKNETTKKAQ